MFKLSTGFSDRVTQYGSKIHHATVTGVTRDTTHRQLWQDPVCLEFPTLDLLGKCHFRFILAQFSQLWNPLSMNNNALTIRKWYHTDTPSLQQWEQWSLKGWCWRRSVWVWAGVSWDGEMDHAPVGPHHWCESGAHELPSYIWDEGVAYSERRPCSWTLSGGESSMECMECCCWWDWEAVHLQCNNWIPWRWKGP